MSDLPILPPGCMIVVQWPDRTRKVLNVSLDGLTVKNTDKHIELSGTIVGEKMIIENPEETLGEDNE